MPGIVATAGTGITPNLLAPSPERYARAAVATIGIQNDTFGYLYHVVWVIIIRSLLGITIIIDMHVL